MKKIVVNKPFFEGCVSIQEKDGCLIPWRLPYEQKALFPSPDEALMAQAGCCSGVRMRFHTNSQNVKLIAEIGDEITPEDSYLFDLVIDNAILETAHWPKTAHDHTFANLPAGSKTVEIWFPLKQQVRVKGLEIDEGAEISVLKDDRPRWVTYGSSITHCKAAHSPARTWPATVARAKGLNLTSLGFGGNCHIEGMVGRVIGELPADFLSMKLGINVHGGSSLSMRTFKGSVLSLIVTVREKHPDVQLAVLSPIYSPNRESIPNPVSMTLQIMRSEIEDAVERVKSVTGDKNLYYFSGLELFNADHEDLLPDGLHPSGDGYELMGKNFIERVYDSIHIDGSFPNGPRTP